MAAAHLAGAGRPGADAVHEAYSFACLNCGYGWEQGYEIEHHRARDGHLVIQYRANGVRVPSPLLKPACPGCGGHTVRIMRAGRIATVENSWHHAPGYAGHAEPDSAAPAAPPLPREHWYQFWRPHA
nr:hypothetical protein [Streptomyces tateyamensis]